MAIQDILPITSISLMGFGFFILLSGVIWLAAQGINDDIQQHSQHMDQDLYILHNKNYDQVIKYKNQGKTSEEIAKELNLGKGEVNLILGLDQMR